MRWILDSTIPAVGPSKVQPAWVYSEPNPVALGPYVPSSDLPGILGFVVPLRPSGSKGPNT